MRLINRSKKSTPGSVACETALAEHVKIYGSYGRQGTKRTYTVAVDGSKITVEVVNRRSSYVATAMTGVRILRNLPAQSYEMALAV